MHAGRETRCLLGERPGAFWERGPETAIWFRVGWWGHTRGQGPWSAMVDELGSQGPVWFKEETDYWPLYSLLAKLNVQIHSAQLPGTPKNTRTLGM